MKTKLLMGIALAGLLSTGLYAYGGNMQGTQQGLMPGNGMNKPMMKKGKPFMRGGFLGALKELNLTPEQQTELTKIRQEMMSKRVKPSEAFSKNGFDKDKYINIKRQQRDNMLESRAEMIDKVYKILTPKQKEQLKVLMDLRADRMLSMSNKRMSFDKNCYGRR